MKQNLSKLQQLLSHMQPGLIEEDLKIEGSLVSAWDELEGTNAESTHAEKVAGRIEQLKWDPPILSFVIERHGGTVQGSSRAAMHQWDVNVDLGLASCNPNHGHRQLRPMDKRLDVKVLAAQIATAIVNCQDHAALKWALDRSTVRILVAGVIPETNKQTTAGRRKRFRKELESVLAPQGWGPAVGKAVGTYRRHQVSAKGGGTP